MSLGKPDVQGEGPGLGPEACQNAKPGGVERLFIITRCGGSQETPHLQGSQLLIEDKKPHQHDHPRKHRHRQVGGGGGEGFLILLLGHPHPGGEGHDLKEEKGGQQIRREKYPHGGSQSKEEKEGKAGPVSFSFLVLPGEDGGHHPHEGGDQTVDQPEAVQSEGEAKAHDPGDVKGKHRLPASGAAVDKDDEHQDEFTCRHKVGEKFPFLIAFFTRKRNQKGSQEGIKHQHGRYQICHGRPPFSPVPRRRSPGRRSVWDWPLPG